MVHTHYGMMDHSLVLKSPYESVMFLWHIDERIGMSSCFK
jgi:hypothetical protein